MKLYLNLILMIIFAALTIASVRAQSIITIDETPKGFIFSDESAIHFDIKTNGFQLGYLWGKYETHYRFKYYHIGLTNVKHRMEYSSKYPVPNIGRVSNSYIYGKINSLFQLKGSIGVRKSFSERPRSKGVVIGYNYEYGLNLGILKPYVLRVNLPGDSGGYNTLLYYSEETKNDFLNQNITIAHAGFRSGWDNVRLRPGINGRLGLNFSFGEHEQFVRALEAGVDASLYFNNVDLIVGGNKPYFLNFYLALQIGWRK